MAEDGNAEDRTAEDGNVKEGFFGKYPIDVTALEKGQIITIGQLEEIMMIKPADYQKWQFGLLQLRKFIESRTEFSVKSTADGLRILTDSEAFAYNHRRFNNHLDGAERRFIRNKLVDSENLTPEERMLHSSNLMNESRSMSALYSATPKRVRIAAHKPEVKQIMPAAVKSVSVEK